MLLGTGNGGVVQQEYFYANTFAGGRGGADGLAISGSAQMIDFDSNVIAANSGPGVEIIGSGVNKLRFVNNTIVGNNGGVTLSPAPANLLWQNNIVVANGGNNAQPASSGTFYNNMPTVSILGSSDATVGTPVTFSESFSDSFGLTAANYLWDLGDGYPETTSTASFTYTEPGTYDVGLVVWDSSGRAAQDELVLTVVANDGFAESSGARASGVGLGIEQSGAGTVHGNSGRRGRSGGRGLHRGRRGPGIGQRITFRFGWHAFTRRVAGRHVDSGPKHAYPADHDHEYMVPA